MERHSAMTRQKTDFFGINFGDSQVSDSAVITLLGHPQAQQRWRSKEHFIIPLGKSINKQGVMCSHCF